MSKASRRKDKIMSDDKFYVWVVYQDRSEDPLDIYGREKAAHDRAYREKQDTGLETWVEKAEVRMG